MGINTSAYVNSETMRNDARNQKDDTSVKDLEEELEEENFVEKECSETLINEENRRNDQEKDDAEANAETDEENNITDAENDAEADAETNPETETEDSVTNEGSVMMLLKKDTAHALVSAEQEVRKSENLEKEDDVNDAENDDEADAETGAETNPENDAEAKDIGVNETHKSEIIIHQM